MNNDVGNGLLIIADVAGQYGALTRLLARYPESQKVVFVGDLVDRGPASDKVIELAMSRPNTETILGNHEHMMLDYYCNLGFYDYGIWTGNGGMTTHASYGWNRPPEAVLDWLKQLPLFLVTADGLLVSHCPLPAKYAGIEDIPDAAADYISPQKFDLALIWNRGQALDRGPDVFQVFGHNSHWGVRSFGNYAQCIDGSASRVLTAFHWPSKTIDQEPYDEQ